MPIMKRRTQNGPPIQGSTTSWVAPMIASVSQSSDLINFAAKIRHWMKHRSGQLNEFQARSRFTAEGLCTKKGTDPGPIVVRGLDFPSGRGSVPFFVQSPAEVTFVSGIGEAAVDTNRPSPP